MQALTPPVPRPRFCEKDAHRRPPTLVCAMSPRCVFGLSAAWRGTHGRQRQSPAVSRVSSSRAAAHCTPAERWTRSSTAG
eukprot:scaffold112391_cov22-Phaeocystis_antarctica.AAC.1